MTPENCADATKPLECYLAIRHLHQRLKPLVGDDPAPWLSIPQGQARDEGGPDPQAYVFKVKLHDRSKLVLSRALLTGELRASVADGINVRDVPGWAWRNPERTKYVWNEGALPLDPLLPAEWLRWSNYRPFLNHAAFDVWLDSVMPERVGSLPELPPPFDIAQEPQASLSEPPDVPFVTLSEALTWIAFGCAVDREHLYLAFEFGSFGDEASVRHALEAATARLMAQACGGRIELRGKHIEGPWADEGNALTRPIESYTFHDFAQFDSLFDGLNFGTGLTWERPPIDRLFSAGRNDAYRAVTVNRSNLLSLFGQHVGSSRAGQKVPANRKLDHDEIRNSAQAMLVERPALSKGSAAASIVADLPPNPRTRKPRDQRHIERIIADLW